MVYHKYNVKSVYVLTFVLNNSQNVNQVCKIMNYLLVYVTVLILCPCSRKFNPQVVNVCSYSFTFLTMITSMSLENIESIHLPTIAYPKRKSVWKRNQERGLRNTVDRSWEKTSWGFHCGSSFRFFLVLYPIRGMLFNNRIMGVCGRYILISFR